MQKNAFYCSLFLHAVILMVLIVNFDLSTPMPVIENSENKHILNAIVMDAPPQIPKIFQKPVLPKLISPSTPKKIEPDLSAKTPVMPVKKPTIAITDKKQIKQKQDFIQKQLLADLKKQTNQQKKIKHSALQAAFEKEMKEIKAKSLQQQMMQEQKRLVNTMTQQARGKVDKYKALILQSVSQHWIIPNNIDKHLTAELLIHVAPDGLVLDVQLIKSSGDAALDRSARAAVFKASPLPVPMDAAAFEAFRQFVLKVRPENVFSTENIV
jgi:colicin import membrane protein